MFFFPLQVYIEVPKVHWSDIGGYHDVKQKLKEVVEWPLKVQGRIRGRRRG